MHKGYTKSAGFTLVELAIVMMIIGILFGGILKGKELLDNARLKSVIKDVYSFATATTSFRDIYAAFPGDFPTAMMRVPSCNVANSCVGGNGDNIVGQTYAANAWSQDQSGVNTAPEVETTMFWKHLVLADLLSSITPTGDPTAPAWGETHPFSRMGGGYHIFTDTQNVGSGSSVAVRFQTPVTGVVSTGAGTMPLKGIHARYIDAKMDDSNPSVGKVIAFPQGATDCWDGAGAAADYVPDSLDEFNCSIYMSIE